MQHLLSNLFYYFPSIGWLFYVGLTISGALVKSSETLSAMPPFKG